MKKIVILLAVVLLAGLTTKTVAQKDRKLSNGFSVNVTLGFPSSHYGTTSDATISSDEKFGTALGLKLGNRWYFSPKDKFGIGLMVNWLDFSFAGKVGTTTEPNLQYSYDWARVFMDFSFLEFGPIGTIALTDDIAIDGYYNLRPTALITGRVRTLSTGDETDAYGGFGFSHALGTAFRYKALNLGLEYVMGGINCTGTHTGSEDETLPDLKIMTNNFRVLLGFKF